MKLLPASLLPMLAAAVLAAGAAVLPAVSAHALVVNSPGMQGVQAGAVPPRIELPQGKEELSISDIRHAVGTHLIRIGALDLKVGKIEKAPEGIAIVYILNGMDDPVGRFGVDVVTAEVFPPSQLQMLLGTASTDDCGDGRTAGLLAGGKAAGDYATRLRAHMLGDGHGWAPWLTNAALGACHDDYKDGGPKIPLNKQIF